MSSYTNTHILEANRLHSPQYNETGSNNAIWTNAVNDGLKLNIGDEVSLHSAFVSDLGAEDSTIEFKGNVIQDKQEFIVSKVDNIETLTQQLLVNNASITHPRYYLRSNISASKVIVNNIKDTDVNVLISYYKNNNGEYMFHMPIKFAVPQSPTDTTTTNSWTYTRDHTEEISGMARCPSASHRFADDYTFDTTNKTLQQNVDGSRYMIFGRSQTNFIKLNGSGGGTFDSHIEQRDLFHRDVEYVRIRDLLQIQAPVGFNSPSQISTVITDGFQKNTDISNNTINYYNGSRLVKRPIGNKNETATNKLFNCATFQNLSTDSSEPFYGTTYGAKTVPTNTQATFDYESGFQYIGIKRPEIYETGIQIKLQYKHLNSGRDRIGTEHCNLLFTDYNASSKSDLEFQHIVDDDDEIKNGGYENTNIANYDYVNELPFGIVGEDDTKIVSLIHTQIPWNDTNLSLLKDFFKAQERYPELFDMERDGCELLYNKNIYNASTYAGDDISPSTNRYIHIGSHRNSQMARQLDVESDGNIKGFSVSFGYDNIPSIFSGCGTSYGAVGGSPSGVNTSGTDFSSAPLFINFYEKTRNDTGSANDHTYYYNTETGDGLWGGFAVRSPPSLVVKDNGSALSLENLPTARNIDPNSYSDTISFIAVVPKPYLIKKTLNTFHNADGSASTTIQNHQVYTLGYIDWWQYVLNPAIYNVSKTYNIPDCENIKVGYDSHPSAYGNAYIGLYNGINTRFGISPDKEYVTAIDENNPINYYNTAGTQLAVNPTKKYADEWINQIYCGAIEPELSFDTITSRFALSSLHSPERITSKYDATLVKTGTSGPSGSLTDGVNIPVPDNNGKECYKVNKAFDRRNFCPTLTPYNKEVGVDIVGTTTNDMFPLPYINQIVKRNSIFDSNSGIFIEDFNIEEKNWQNSFWGICGFSYENLNNDDTGNINIRVFTGVLGNIAKITTNAQVVNDALLEWNGEGTGVPANKYTTPKPIIFDFQNAHHTATSAVANPPMEVECESAKIEASNLPTKTLRPYFIIRSDIISDSYYSGGQNEPSTMPVLSVIPKESQYGDYYYSTDTTTFTITHPRTITKITTQITDPSGKPSNLSPNSAVLYKIIKQKTLNNTIAQQVLQQNK